MAIPKNFPSPGSQAHPSQAVNHRTIDIAEHISSPATEAPSLCGRVSAFFSAIARAISNLFYSIFGWEGPLPSPGFISTDLIAQRRLGWDGILYDHLMLKEIFKNYKNKLKNEVFRVEDPEAKDRALSSWLEEIHESGLQDTEIDQIKRLALLSLQNEKEDQRAIENLKKTVQIEINMYRYERLLRDLHNTPIVAIKEQSAPGDGNCFLHSCSQGLKRVTEGRETISYRELRSRMVEEFDRAIKSTSKEDCDFRCKFIQQFNGGASGCGEILPHLEAWEEEIMKSYDNPYALLQSGKDALELVIRELPLTTTIHPPLKAASRLQEKLNQRGAHFDTWELYFTKKWGKQVLLDKKPEHIACTMSQTKHGAFLNVQDVAKSLRLKLKQQQQYLLNQDEEALFIEKGFDPQNTNGLSKQFKQRMKNIYHVYLEDHLACNGKWNGDFEAILAARVLKRPIVILHKESGSWQYQGSLIGKEFLLPLDQLPESPPITVLHDGKRKHYTTGYYPKRLPEAFEQPQPQT